MRRGFLISAKNQGRQVVEKLRSGVASSEPLHAPTLGEAGWAEDSQYREQQRTGLFRRLHFNDQRAQLQLAAISQRHLLPVDLVLKLHLPADKGH